MPPEFRFGYPLEEGTVLPATYLYATVGDGTRQASMRLVRSGYYRVSTSGPPGSVVSGNLVGLIPSRNRIQLSDLSPHIDIDESVQLKMIERLGGWLTLPDADGIISAVPYPVTPGDDYYRFRGILDSHAQRFLVEHNPASLRVADPLHARIEHISHELSDADRMNAGNVSEWTREKIGYLWWRVEHFRAMPFGTAEVDAAWRAERDAIDALMMPFCALCEGSGMSYRTMRKHPADDWKRWLEAAVRFSSDREFNASPVAGASMVTAAVAFGNRINFRNALDHNAEGHPDDDYLEPRTTVRAQAAAPVMPTFTGDHAMERAELASYWRIQYDDYKVTAASRQATEVLIGIYRNWIVFNLLFMLHDENLSTRYPNAALQANKTASADSALITTLAGRFSAAVFNPWAGTFPDTLGGFLVYDPLNNSFIVAGGRVTDDGTDNQAGPLAAWDTAVREQRFAIVDTILGDRTAGRPAA